MMNVYYFEWQKCQYIPDSVIGDFMPLKCLSRLLYIITWKPSFGGYPPYSYHSVRPHFMSYNNSWSYDLSKKCLQIHCNSSINHISFYLCYQLIVLFLSPEYTLMLITPPETVVPQKRANGLSCLSSRSTCQLYITTSIVSSNPSLARCTRYNINW
jgi:hypothetical protein